MKIFIYVMLLIGFSYGSVVNNYLNTLQEEIKKEKPTFTGFSIKRGKDIFTSKHIGKRGKEISCVSCHTNDFTKRGENFFTTKVIEPLSPQTNPKRFKKLKTIKKWLRRNFKDVYNRVGTAQEKGDVITYILSKDKK
jgi:cytochrome c